jgi:hypothetical protein
MMHVISTQAGRNPYFYSYFVQLKTDMTVVIIYTVPYTSTIYQYFKIL